MAKQSEFDDLFNPQVEMNEGTSKKSSDYEPSSDKGKNGVYQSVIRFVTWWENPKQSIQEKWVAWLMDPITNKGKYVDCPSTIGKPSPLADMYWKLKKSESVADQKKAEIFSRRHNYSCLVQVVKDDNAPDLVGKILVWRFGKKIWDKINAELKPVYGEPHNPFDLLNGKAFGLTITKVSGYNNYDQSKFVDKAIPLLIPDETGKLVPINTSSDKKAVFEFLKTNSGDLNKYAYKEWDQDTLDYVNNVINAVTGQHSFSTKLADTNNANVGANPVAAKPKVNDGIIKTDISIDEIGNSDYTTGLESFNSGTDDLGSIGNLGGLGSLDDIMKGL
jgi:hypothetical protein